MTYDVKLIDANIEHAMKGEMRLGITQNGQLEAMVEYDWTGDYFNARFVGHAPTMPEPAHPTAFLFRPIEAIQALKTQKHQLPTDVFKDHKVSFNVNA